MWLVLLLSYILSASCGSPYDDVTVKVQNLSIGEVQRLTLNDKLEYVLVVHNMTCSLALSPPRISLNCPDCNEDNPLLVAIRQRKGILSWELPIMEDPIDKEAFRHTDRTLCPFDIMESSSCQKPSNETSHLMVDLSTSSTQNITAEVSLELEHEFVISLHTPKNITVSPASPRYLVYQFKETNASSVLLRVSSTNDVCMTVSVQHIGCPVNDGESNVQRSGYFQSVTQSSGITIQREDYPDGFYAVFVVHATDRVCGRSFLEAGNRTKDIFVLLEETITIADYAVAVLATLGVLFGLSFIIIIAMVFYFRNLTYYYPDASKTPDADPQSAIAAIQSLTASVVTNPRSEHSLNDDVSTDSSLDETDIDMLRDIESDKNLWRSKSVLTVFDLSKKMPSVLGKKSELYLWYLLTVSVFYFLPVVQLVITYQRMIYMTGNQNVCYFNFLCAHPWGISDFNHVFSNIGYAVMGLLFIGITRYRHKIHLKMVLRNKAIDRFYGIPQHFGLFYAMGAALTVEGVLSGCYHVCPNSYNFQFDTSFMYVISTLCMLKLYHTRHPDISASAYATFAILSLAILFGMCGVLSGTPSFWSIFTLIHLSACFLLSLQIYYLGRWRFNVFFTCNCIRMFCAKIQMRQFRAILPTYPSRFVIIFLANLVNLALAILGPMYIIGQFATYLLAIFMVNLILYTFFYISMKVYNKEKIGRTPWVLIGLSCISWAGSLYFFFNKSISWKLTPAESKLYNQQCLIFDFYDNHDIWHFLSAASMFLSFMVLLTLDDAVLDVPREQIAVF